MCAHERVPKDGLVYGCAIRDCGSYISCMDVFSFSPFCSQESQETQNEGRSKNLIWHPAFFPAVSAEPQVHYRKWIFLGEWHVLTMPFHAPSIHLTVIAGKKQLRFIWVGCVLPGDSPFTEFSLLSCTSYLALHKSQLTDLLGHGLLKAISEGTENPALSTYFMVSAHCTKLFLENVDLCFKPPGFRMFQGKIFEIKKPNLYFQSLQILMDTHLFHLKLCCDAVSCILRGGE